MSPLGMSIDHNRTQAIHNFPPSINVQGIAHFVGMVHLYRILHVLPPHSKALP
jgi:hypothetical protein